VFGALGHCPRDKLLGIHLPRINFALKKLDETTPEAWEGGHYWDGTYNQVGDNQCSLADYCLGHFLRGYIQASARYQVRSTILDYYTSAPSLSSRLHSGVHVHALTSQPTCASESALKLVPGQPSDDEIDRAAEKDYEACLRHSPDVEVSERYARDGGHLTELSSTTISCTTAITSWAGCMRDGETKRTRGGTLM